MSRPRRQRLDGAHYGGAFGVSDQKYAALIAYSVGDLRFVIIFVFGVRVSDLFSFL